MKKILIILSSGRQPDNQYLYDCLSKYIETTIIKLTSEEQKNLKKNLKYINFNNYDYIYLDLFFKRIYKQSRFIKKINNLVVFEEDVCQNYIPTSKWFGKFLIFYKKLSEFKLLVTGQIYAERLTDSGINASYFPKGFDDSILSNKNIKRDIELGFIGRTDSVVYKARYHFLTTLSKNSSLQILRTKPGEDYANMLNRIEFFISADIGLGEYMIKNFEAMACGCILCAYKQGDNIEENLGLVDMENIILYSDEEGLKEKIDIVKSDPILYNRIKQSSEELAHKKFSYSQLAPLLIHVIAL